ncbi:MAG TPA: hypothetical protein VLJ61_11490 [Pyrinomonadaceae bacterium]|nr:hypothetical protein [Pyrinomonadaceae bacterium]
MVTRAASVRVRISSAASLATAAEAYNCGGGARKAGQSGESANAKDVETTGEPLAAGDQSEDEGMIVNRLL